MWRRKPKLTADSFAHDPLAQRIFIRSQREHEQRAARDAFWDGAWRGGTLSGKVFAAVPIYLLLSLGWAILSSILEEFGLYARATQDWRRARRGNKYVRRARRDRSYSGV